MGDAGELGGGNWGDGDLQVQPGEEILEGGNGGAESFPLQVLLVELGAFGILLSASIAIERPGMRQELGNAIGLAGEFQGEHLRTVGLNFGAFDRVVVDEDEAVETQVQFSGEGFQVLGFGLPVNFGGDDPIARQGHIGTAIEHRPDIRFHVFAAQTQQHPGIGAVHHKFLQCPILGIDGNSLGAILAANPFPQGIVAIENHHFVGGALQGVDFPGDRRSQGGEEGGGVRNPTEFVSVGIVVIFNGIGLIYLGRFE